MEVQDVLADVEENELNGFDDVRAYRPERKALNVGALDLWQATLGWLEGKDCVERIGRIEGRHRRVRSRMQDKSVGFRLSAELDSEQVRHFALIPAKKRTDRGDAGDGGAWLAAPHKELFLLAFASDVAEFDAAGSWIPGVGHLHPATSANDAFHGGR